MREKKGAINIAFFNLKQINIFLANMSCWLFQRREPEKKVADVDEKTLNMNINIELSKAKQEEDRAVTLLLLGTRGSGKSTLLKRAQGTYGEILQRDLQVTTMAVRKQVLDDIIDLCQANKELSASDTSLQIEDEKCCQIRDEFAALFGKVTDEMEFTKTMSRNVKLLWALAEMKRTWKIRANTHIMESTPYFFKKANKIADPTYCADLADHVFLNVYCI
ncbi:heterotrimeric G protein alpha subunit 1 [Reticulomyxa filosa]|uniref:Heterotrimeric G protein alpha subunit 1 n=1 Tax=Reticulomyxa filosa TaxID=46433 RepID=X6NQ12_RETFI|nr:heterotrimeric G protein alpha subunit 1 [Reticulomyxa filosa]|eukprot:ETO27804.1 heterotrimeric G protein alpha subunit 1 [Reticulomyxa filosa]